MENYLGQLFHTKIEINKSDIINAAKEYVLKKYPELVEEDIFKDIVIRECERRITLEIQKHVQEIQNEPTKYGLPEIKLVFWASSMTSKKIDKISSGNQLVEYTLYFAKEKKKYIAPNKKAMEGR